MKKYRLKKWVKVVLTIIIMLFSLFIYFKSNEFAVAERIDLAIASWMWLIGGQLIVLDRLWTREVDQWQS